jgi:hypothetical protein
MMDLSPWWLILKRAISDLRPACESGSQAGRGIALLDSDRFR